MIVVQKSNEINVFLNADHRISIMEKDDHECPCISVRLSDVEALIEALRLTLQQAREPAAK